MKLKHCIYEFCHGASIDRESNLMPAKEKVVDGPTVLFGAMGIHNKNKGAKIKLDIVNRPHKKELL